jgi:hypothetical protein
VEPDKAVQTPVLRMIQIGGVVYNADHIVKIDLRQPERAIVHTTVGADEFDGEVALSVARFYAAPPDPPALPPATKGKK